MFINSLRYNVLRNEASEGGDGSSGTTTETNVLDAGTQLAPLIDEKFNFADGYQDRLGEVASGSTFKNLPDLFKSVNEGTKTIQTLNQEKATLTQQLADLGQENAPPVIPETADAYKAAMKLPGDTELPEGVTLPPDLVDAATSFALKNNIAPDVLEKFVNFQIEQASGEYQSSANAFQEKLSNATDEIKTAVGAQNFDATIANAKAANEALGLGMEAEDLVSQPRFVIALARVKDMISEDALKGASTSEHASAISAGSKLQQANDIVSNESNPLHEAFFDNAHPQHNDALSTHSRLIAESGRA